MGVVKLIRYVIFGICLIVILIGLDIFCRFLYYKDWFGTTKLLDTIDPIAVIALIVSSLITVYVGIMIVKSFSEERYKKEYLIGELKLIEEEVNSFEALIAYAVSVDLGDVMKIINKINVYIERHSKTLDVFEVNVDNSVLKNRFNQMYGAATNVTGNQLLLDPALRNILNLHCGNLILESRKMIHNINKI